MNCERVADRLRRGEELAANDFDHASECGVCDALLKLRPLLGEPDEEPALEFDLLLEATEHRVKNERGVRASMRAWETRWKTAMVLGLFFVLLACVGVLMHRPHDPLYDVGRLFGTLTLMVGFTCYACVRGLRGPDRSDRSVVGLALVFLGVSVFDSGLPASPSIHVLDHVHFVRATTSCFVFGFLMGLPISVLVAWFDRRDRPLAGRMLIAGATGGIAGLALSYLHCPAVDREHIALGHSLSALVLAGTVVLGWMLVSRWRAA